MSRQYDAKQAALAAYPTDREAAIELFVGYVGGDRCDIDYDLGMTVEEYLFGKDKDDGISKRV